MNRRSTPLRIAQEEAHRLIKEDEKFVGELKTLLRAAAEKVIKIDLDKMANKMADAFVCSLRGR